MRTSKRGRAKEQPKRGKRRRVSEAVRTPRTEPRRKLHFSTVAELVAVNWMRQTCDPEYETRGFYGVHPPGEAHGVPSMADTMRVVDAFDVASSFTRRCMRSAVHVVRNGATFSHSIGYCRDFVAFCEGKLEGCKALSDAVTAHRGPLYELLTRRTEPQGDVGDFFEEEVEPIQALARFRDLEMRTWRRVAMGMQTQLSTMRDECARNSKGDADLTEARYLTPPGQNVWANCERSPVERGAGDMPTDSVDPCACASVPALMASGKVVEAWQNLGTWRGRVDRGLPLDVLLCGIAKNQRLVDQLVRQTGKCSGARRAGRPRTHRCGGLQMDVGYGGSMSHNSSLTPLLRDERVVRILSNKIERYVYDFVLSRGDHLSPSDVATLSAQLMPMARSDCDVCKTVPGVAHFEHLVPSPPPCYAIFTNKACAVLDTIDPGVNSRSGAVNTRTIRTHLVVEAGHRHLRITNADRTHVTCGYDEVRSIVTMADLHNRAASFLLRFHGRTEVTTHTRVGWLQDHTDTDTKADTMVALNSTARHPDNVLQHGQEQFAIVHNLLQAEDLNYTLNAHPDEDPVNDEDAEVAPDDGYPRTPIGATLISRCDAIVSGTTHRQAYWNGPSQYRLAKYHMDTPATSGAMYLAMVPNLDASSCALKML